MAVSIFPAASGGGLTGFALDVTEAGTSAFGTVSGGAGIYEVIFWPASGATPRTAVNFTGAGGASVGNVQLIDSDLGALGSYQVGRVIATGDVTGWSVFSEGVGWAVARQLQSSANIRKVFRLTTSGSITTTGPIAVFVMGGGGGGGGARFGSSRGGGGGGSGRYQTGTISSASTYSYTIGAGGAAGSDEWANGNAGGNTTIFTFAGAGGSGGVNGLSGGTGGAGGSGGGGGGNSATNYGNGGIAGANGAASSDGTSAGGTGSGTAPAGWTGDGAVFQTAIGAAGGFAQGGAGGSKTFQGTGASAAANTGGGGGGSSSTGSGAPASGGGSGVIYYYYI